MIEEMFTQAQEIPSEMTTEKVRKRRRFTLPEFPRFTKRQVIVFLYRLCFAALCYMVFGLIRFIAVPLLLFVIWGSGLVKKIPSKVFYTLLVVIFGLGNVPMGMQSQSLWKYPAQKTLCFSFYSNIRELDWFPDFRSDVESGFEFDYAPSVMQGTGHYSVYLEAADKTVTKYISKYENERSFTFTLDEFRDGRIYDGHITQLDKEKDKNASMSFYQGRHYSGIEYGKLEEDVLGAVVYVLRKPIMISTAPKTSAVIIDKDNKTIFSFTVGIKQKQEKQK